MDSLASRLMLGTTLYRNQPGLVHKVAAEAGYALIAIVATVETVAAATFSALALAALPFSNKPFSHAAKWLNSSAFCLVWSVADLFFNLTMERLVADEPSARYFFNNGDLRRCPSAPLYAL